MISNPCRFGGPFIFPMLAVAVLLYATQVVADSSPLLDRPLRIVTEAWHPYVFQDADGEPAGSHWEIVETVFAELGQAIEIRFCPWKRCIEQVRNGNADALLGARRTPEREAFMMFPENPLSTSSAGIFIRRDSDPEYKTLTDLAGDRGGTVLGYNYCNAVENSNLKLETERSLDGNFRKLLLGRIDYVISNLVAAESAIRSAGFEDVIIRVPDLDACRDVTNFLPFAKKDDLRPLLQAFDSALGLFRTTEKYRRIEERYNIDSPKRSQ